MLVIGLTGGIGTGKSTVSEMLGALGAYIINADLVGHQAYLPHQNVWQDMVDAFGRDILTENDEVDRRKLGPIVFGNPEAMDKLNSIVRPWMYRTIEQMIVDESAKGTKVGVVEAAILLEANWQPLADQIWVTVASEENVIQRVMARNSMTEEQVKARIQAQTSDEVRTAAADVVIDTNTTLEEVKARVQAAWEQAVAKQGETAR